MTQTLADDPKEDIKDLLKNNWDNTNTSISEDPRFHTGWWNGSYSGQAQVTVSDPDENVLAGGQTGFTGMSNDGAGTKIMTGNVDVNTWAHHDMYSVNAKQLSFEMSEEVKRIIGDNTFGISYLDYISWAGRVEIVDTDAPNTLFRYENEIRYGYTVLP